MADDVQGDGGRADLRAADGRHLRLALAALESPLQRFLGAALPVLRAHPALIGVAAGGSYATGRLDEYSDLDLLVVAKPSAWPGVLEQRQAIAASLGPPPLLVAFTGEHVHEPRLLICLYGPPALHVDLKFVLADDLLMRVEDPVALWDGDGSLARALAARPAAYPVPDVQWIEDRIWVWVHYAAGKIGRGELFEAADFLAFLRATALGPLSLRRAGARPTGVRRIELDAPAAAGPLSATVAGPNRRECADALRAAIALYRELRDELVGPGFTPRRAAEREAIAYLEAVAR